MGSTANRDVNAYRGRDQSQDRNRNNSNTPDIKRWPLSKPRPMIGHVTLVAQYVTDVFYIFNSTVVD